ncbi:MAG: septum formation inhibitor Maf [Epsilonproteobacteria bacterium]|jgi:septum formation protein|nr:septum formation inhibitor Maf [Campylobacterota bacterium]
MIILASASTTRAKILQKHSIDFIQKSCDFDEESIKTDSAKEFVYLSAKGKMTLCEERYGIKTPLLCADTVVSSNDKILRKAKDKEDAKRILLEQSGNKVSILTCMLYKSETFSFTDLSATVYEFGEFDEKDLEEFLKSGEWKGKAGACMVEGFCKKYIKEVKGLESCAMGLQIEKLIPFLKL